MKPRRLGHINIGFLYIGAIMGAGFASGREIWQFFGVFNSFGYIGILLTIAFFIAIGLITCYISNKLSTNKLGLIIVPYKSKKAISIIEYLMAIILYTVLIIMSAAGGALFNQQFEQSRIFGGIVIVLLVLLTVIGGIDRISIVFRYIMPILIIIVVVVSILLITLYFSVEL